MIFHLPSWAVLLIWTLVFGFIYVAVDLSLKKRRRLRESKMNLEVNVIQNYTSKDSNKTSL